MCLIRKSILVAILALAMFPGCVRKSAQTPDMVTEPVATDEAMQKRDWPLKSALYQNGSTVAGPTQFNYIGKPEQPEWTYYYSDFGAFMANMGLLPYNLIAHPQWTTQVYTGAVVPPSYTAVPPLPASAASPVATVEEPGHVVHGPGEPNPYVAPQPAPPVEPSSPTSDPEYRQHGPGEPNPFRAPEPSPEPAPATQPS